MKAPGPISIPGFQVASQSGPFVARPKLHDTLSQNSRFGTNWPFGHVGDPSPLYKEQVRFCVRQRPADGMNITCGNFISKDLR